MNDFGLKYYVGLCMVVLIVGCQQKNEKTKKETANEPLDSESIYQLPGEWHTHNGDTIQLKSLVGKIPVVAMVYTSCGFACPRIVADIENIEKKIPKDKKDEVVFVLVSFDSEKDTPNRLKAYAKEMKLDEKWLLLHGDEELVRELSMLLNVKYKKQTDGNFAHSNGITLLNTKGVIVEQVEGLGVSGQPILDKIEYM